MDFDKLAIQVRNFENRLAAVERSGGAAGGDTDALRAQFNEAGEAFVERVRKMVGEAGEERDRTIDGLRQEVAELKGQIKEYLTTLEGFVARGETPAGASGEPAPADAPENAGGAAQPAPPQG